MYSIYSMNFATHSFSLCLQNQNEDINLLVNDLNAINPAYIPRNHQIQDVIDLAYENNFSKMLEMIEVVQDPFKEKDKYSSYMNAPSGEQKVKRTFCGT